ncbi:phosphoribosylformylglycinamidine cyclo-ligase [Holzapfeliella floricola]|uniref:Phosphoribosylformylglycinamidine cyclo-ligase n=1 Tax=Holzapfeliella floricola DSM 23037 = JCM 16512 TaxID=1423744 RepID=A0A0R2DUS7_9LACO|nr:phosphoribosylformylglycinamidine cyclo-ligase [Holzapfeliella floricola]KRN03965.1 phosphoribosylformylglycinamidine cyclo-ligase [Holzapfeliella floricola DSM 23037 = JCM 16512]
MTNQYKKAGVDIKAGENAVDAIKPIVKATQNANVLSTIGGFGAEYELTNVLKGIKEPVLISGTDGVGTKLMLALKHNRNENIGIDLVAMCVNDILAQGANPLFFLDYVGVGKLEPANMKEIVNGIAEGCKLGNMALIGGEMAEMPGLYDTDEYDLSGFAVGLVDKSKILTKQNVKEGDVLIGLASSGIHSNGYSLVRKIIDDNQLDLNEYREELNGTLLDVVMAPTQIYFNQLNPLFEESLVHAVAHITGGGITENLERIIPEYLTAKVYKNTWQQPAIFDLLQREGQVSQEEMDSVFNMGLGMIMAVAPENVEQVKTILGDDCYQIGQVENRHDKPVEIIY